MALLGASEAVLLGPRLTCPSAKADAMRLLYRLSYCFLSISKLA